MPQHRIKEEERIEKSIRGLLKLQENRRCINCSSLGPQYVCTTFWTFVCTNCGGVHREFTHRVKSVSMAKFNAEEVSALEAGGNERAREIYFKTWDSQRNSLPDGSNLHRLRDFIKHVYVERRFTGDKSSDKLSMVKMDFRDGFYEKRSYDRHSTGCRDKYYDRRPNFDLSTPRNLRNFLDRENGSPGGRSSRPSARFEIVDDRFRDDNYGNVKCYEINRFGGRSLSSDTCRSREDTKEKREVPDSTCSEKAAVCSSPASTGEKQVEQKAEKSSSLIDSECDDASKELETPSTNGENPSSLPQTAPEKASSKPPSVNSVEALLLELAAPVDASSSATPAAEFNTADDKETAQPFPSNSNSNSGDSLVEVNERQPLPDTQQDQPCASPVVDSSHTDQKNSLPIEDSSNHSSRPSSAPDLQAQALSNQLSSPSLAPNSQAQESSNQLSSPLSAPNSQAQDSHNQQSLPSPDPQQVANSQAISNLPIQDSEAPTHSDSTEEPSQVTSKQSQEISSARKELPADIFTALYPSYPTQVPFGHYHPPQEMGVGMQYNPSAAIAPGLPITSKSKNPFDFGDDAPLAPNPMFPSLQGAFRHLSAQMPPSPYAFALAHQLPSYGMALPPGPGANVGLQPPNTTLQLSRPQENIESNNGEGAFASLNPLQYSKPRFQANSYSPPTGGNPFG